MADRFGVRKREADVRFRNQLQKEGLKELPAFDPNKFRQRVESARGEIAAPSLRSLEQLARQQQVQGRFDNPAVQAAGQGQSLEGFGAGRGQILAGAGEAALGRELPIQQLQQQGRNEFQGRLNELRQGQAQDTQQAGASRMQQLQEDLFRQRRLEGTMEDTRQRFREMSDRERIQEQETKASNLANSGPQGGGGNLSQTANNIIRAFGSKAGRR